MSQRITIRIPEELSTAVDGLVDAGLFATRADAVRAALETLVDGERRREIGSRIADGYPRIPQDQEEVAGATEAAIRSIHEEPE